MLHWIVTLATLVGALGLAVLANAQAGRPWNEPRPRLVPWRVVMILSVFLALMAVVHALNLFGLETGPENGLFGRF